jgi:hypoxanthine phosphoribosyltransferase
LIDPGLLLFGCHWVVIGIMNMSKVRVLSRQEWSFVLCRGVMQDYLSGILLSSASLDEGIKRLAKRIADDYAGTCPHLLCILNGASVFTMRLYTELHRAAAANEKQGATVPFTCGFVKLSSYSGTHSTGEVGVGPLDGQPIKGRDIIVVEDIVDTGLSMAKLLPLLRREHGAKSTRVCTLLEKRTEKACELKAWYSGFSIPNAFVVGFGLDLDEAFRDMECVGVINDAGISKFGGFIESVKAEAAAAVSPTAA